MLGNFLVLVLIIFDSAQLIKATEIYYKFQKIVIKHEEETLLKRNLLLRWLGIPAIYSHIHE